MWGADESGPFPVVRRGYDKEAVNKRIRDLEAERDEHAARVSDLERKLEELQSRVEDQQIETRAALRDPEKASEIVGREAAEILRTATEAAANLRRKAEAAAAEILDRANRQATELERQARVDAESELSEAKEAAKAHLEEIRMQGAEILRMADRTAASTVDAAKREGRSLVIRAKEHAEKTIADAEARLSLLKEQIAELELRRVALRQILAGARQLVTEALEQTGGDIEEVESLPKSPQSGLVEADPREEPEPGAGDALDRVAKPDPAADDPGARPEFELVNTTSRADVPDFVSEQDQAPDDAAPESGDDGQDQDTVQVIDEDETFQLFSSLVEQSDEDAPDGTGDGLVEQEESDEISDEAVRRDLALEQTQSTTDTVAERLSKLEQVFAELKRVSETAPVVDPEPALRPETPPDASRDGEMETADDEQEVPEPQQLDELDSDGLAPELASVLAEVFPQREAALVRRVKRILQDDINQVLVALRQHGVANGLSEARAVLESYASRREQLAGLVSDLIEAGTQFGLVVAPGAAKAGGVSGESMAERLANAIAEVAIEPVVRILGDDVEDRDEVAAVAEVSAFYREVRNRQLEETVADFSIEAFNTGIKLVGDPVAYHWYSWPHRRPCADCEDNVLAGDNPVSELFPTGHEKPPAHPGCKCIIVPVFA
jgi:hypothetical protein